VLPTLCFTDNKAELLEQLRAVNAALEIRLVDETNLHESIDGPALYFIDWLLPGIAGIEICRSLRDKPSTRNAHITMLLDEDDNGLKKRALSAGADDYLISPLTLEKLSGRLSLYGFQSTLKTERRTLSCGALEVDLTAFSVRFDGRRVDVSPNELRLLTQFMENRDEALTRQNLIMMVGKDSDKIEEKTVDVWVGRLRKALRKQGAPDPIRAVKSVGYVFDSQVAVQTSTI
jgi:two-component system, OmpR family, phosphate regulon response regulator PhoB